MKRSLALIACLIPVLLSGSSALADLTPQEELGKLLFFDTNLSTPPGQSCAACHDPATAFAGPDSDINAHGAVYPGAVHVRFGNRKPPTSAYASFSPDFYYDEVEGLYIGGMFWDGRALNTIEQAKGPFLNPVEQNNPNMKHVVNKVRKSDYAMLFQEVYGYGAFMDVEMAYQYIAEAIAAYEASSEVNRFSSKYDAYLAGLAELTEQEMRGLMLYEGQGNCAACHPSQPGPGGEPPLFTDFTYDNLGVPKNMENPWYDMPGGFNPEGADWIDYGLGGRLDLPEEMGKMKVPTLRNVGMKPYPEFVQAYTHNGVFKSLHEVVDFYNTRDLGGWAPPEVPENVNTEELGNLGLSDQDVDDIVAFLNTLTDGYMEQMGLMPAGPGLKVAYRAPAMPAEISPNPFHDHTALRFRLGNDAPVTVAVFDAAGRQVRALAAGEPLGSGAHAISWDGVDDGGRSVPAGAYFLRLQVDGQQTVQRVIRIR